MTRLLPHLLLSAMLTFFTASNAQDHPTGWLAVETDPITTAFGARTLSVLIEPPKLSHWSVFVNGVTADFPTWMDDRLNPRNEGHGFDHRIAWGGGVAVDYFLREERAGWYAGVMHLFFRYEVERAGAEEQT